MKDWCIYKSVIIWYGDILSLFWNQDKEKITSMIIMYFLDPFNHNLSVSQGPSLQLTKHPLKYYKQKINVDNNIS